MQQVAEASAIIPDEDIALFALFGLNYAGSNFVGGKSLGTGTRTRICMKDVQVPGGIILPQYPLLLKKCLLILS
ncbi:hypothetical protein JCM10550A_20560 [Methanogenium cariaci]